MEDREAVCRKNAVAGGRKRIDVFGNRNADICGLQRACVVEAVADHHDLPSFGAQALHEVKLVFRRLLEMHADILTEHGAESRGFAVAVAGYRHKTVRRLEGSHKIGEALTIQIRNAEMTARNTIDGHIYGTVPGIIYISDAVQGPFGRSDHEVVSSDAPFNALARQFVVIVDVVCHVAGERSEHLTTQRMRALSEQRFRHRALVFCECGTVPANLRAARLRERAGFVEHYRIDARERFDSVGVFCIKAVVAENTLGRAKCERGRECEGAGTGNDQYGGEHRGHQRGIVHQPEDGCAKRDRNHGGSKVFADAVDH